MPKEKETTAKNGDIIRWQEHLLYFKGTDRSSGSITVIDHMNSFEDRIGVNNCLFSKNIK